MSNPVISARGRLGYAKRIGDPQTVSDAKRDLAAAKLEAYIARVVAEAPPLTSAQRDKLAGLLRTAEPAPKVLRRPTSINERILTGGDVE